ncbi:response regulator [Leptolyngbya sp. FACHB-17]|uniref:response regulator n=1 Tax=unclassified Leptolyngbya TaxID=2650499 RepID=UPI001680324D|nr:response regulator [Leptolyngbya sp. FACHB-17]MBD2078868.1 response regulator [Leptolyngbya sp. FACHB-17]
MRILVIEDDRLTAETLATILTAHHYAIEVATTGKAGLALLNSFEYDLLILDIGLPDLDGIEVCRRIRSIPAQLPILLLTAYQGYHDRALGLDAGADDYLVKPFDEEELMARIRALLRRGNAASSPLLEWNDLQLDPSTCEVQYRSHPLILTPKEYALLELFLRNGRRVFSCGSIIEHLWAFEDAPSEEAVRTHIKGLRQKLKSAGAPPDFIETVYGIGYRLKPISSVPTDARSVKQELRSKLSTIWHHHKDQVTQQIAIIEKSVHQANARVQSQAIQQAHSLIGSLGSLGFPEGSQIARQIESILAKPSLNAKSLKQLKELISTLRRVIDLPASTTDQTCAESRTEESRTDLPKSTIPQSLILIVSRDPSFINPIEREMCVWNYQNAIISTPKSVIKLCENESPSLVLLDLECFDLLNTGLELLSSFQHHSPVIPAIVFTARNDFTERLEVVRRGGRLLLPRSITGSQTLEAIHQVIPKTPHPSARILIVDDDIALLEALVKRLSLSGLNVFTLNNPYCLCEALETIAPDVLILNLEFSDVNGIELCQVVRNDWRWLHLPIIILATQSCSDAIAPAFTAGADDFVSKPILESELVARLFNQLERVKLLRQLTETDWLTGAANRQKSTQSLEAFLRSSDCNNQPTALAVIDIDRLRDVNAQYGHTAGDSVLRQFAILLQQSFCDEDIVARWGGEEFVIGMYGTTRENGVQRLIRVLERINQQAMLTDAGEALQVTFSAGVAQYPADGKDLRTLYRVANLALRQAKQLQQEAHPYSSILPAESELLLKS